MKLKAAVILLGMVFMISLAGGALAADHVTTGNPGDTESGNRITSEGSENTLNYKDTAQNDRPEEYGSTIEVIAGSVIGFYATGNPDAPYSAATTPGSTESWIFAATNEGNVDFTSTITFSAIAYTGGSDNWTVEAWHQGAPQGIPWTPTLSEDSDIFSEIKITPATTEADAPDMSTGEVTMYVTTGYSGSGSGLGSTYTGANDLTYGGIGAGVPDFDVTVNAPIMSLTRISTIESPEHYTGWGGDHDFVPGSLLVFTLTYTNEGTGDGSNISIIDQIPYDCVAYKINVEAPETNLNYVTASTMTGEVTWAIYYSTEEAPSFTHYNTNTGKETYQEGWYRGVGNAGYNDTIGPPYDSELAVDTTKAPLMKWIKFQTGSLEAGADGTIQWSVYLK